MSFELECQNCGAISSPAVGTCPYCKSVLVSSKGHQSPVVSRIRKLYDEGKLERALFLGNEFIKEEKNADNVPALVLVSKILLETEGPSSKIKSLLGKAFLSEPENPEVTEYLEIAEAKFELTHANAEKGEEMLKTLLRRAPQNPHALFLMGSHLFWRKESPVEALSYLERCVKVRPHFLRAWACLGGIARSLNNTSLASYAFRKCIALETNTGMKSFLNQLAMDDLSKKAA